MASTLKRYYGPASLGPSSLVLEPAQEAFDQALETMRQIPTPHSKTRKRVFETTNLRDLLDSITTAQKRFENRHMGSKTRQCITELSKRICYYGNIMDVLVQHHPEYVALAWGAMKLVFGAVVEHEKLGRTIITGLCDVADALSRVEIAAYLYSTHAMKGAIAALYAHIMKFLLRALNWYEEGKIAHAIHSITRPAALRYDDLLEDIRRGSRVVADLAITSSQAEQRDMHQELQALTVLVKQLREEMVLDQSLKASKLLDCRQAISDVQMTQALTLISSTCNIDHRSSLQASLLIRDKHRYNSQRSKCPPFWTSSELHSWNVDQSSSSITIRAPFKSRFYIRDFCTNAIEQLRKASVSVLWVLKPKEQIYYSVTEVLKSFVYQVINLDPVARTESTLPFKLRQFLDAYLDDDYVNLLGSSLKNLKLVYIIVEAGAMDPASALKCQKYLQDLSQRLSERSSAVTLKVMVLTHGLDTQHLKDDDSHSLRIRQISSRKGKTIPTEPLESVGGSGPQRRAKKGASRAMPFRARARVIRATGD